jgi:hypothetical protein
MATTSFPELLQRFFAHLRSAREVSPHTTAAYRDTFRLLLPFIAKRCRISVDQITLEVFVPDMILAFLDHLQRDRRNTARTRNARLAGTLHGELSDWSSEISVINGGLLLEPDLSSAMYVAPTNGYTPVFQYNQQIKGGQRGSTGDKRFYIMLKNGREYGRMTIGLFAPYNSEIPGLIRIDFAINPTGSHILR